MLFIYVFAITLFHNVLNLNVFLIFIYLFYREYKYIALISLGNILHHCRHSDEAAIVVRAAVDNAPDSAICHFTLGNIYAVSLVCYF